MKKILFLFSFVFFISNAFASHVAGGNISYTFLAKDLYEIKLVLFRDCSGIEVSNQEPLTITNTCGFSETIYLINDTLSSRNISMVCNQFIDSTKCNTEGTLQGFTEYVYKATYRLNSNCALWTFNWNLCCRNVSYNIASSSTQYITLKTTLNNLNFNGNNSVRFIDPYPIPQVCSNQNTLLNMGGVDEDNDSLIYEFVSALGLNGDTIPYIAGHSGTKPIPGITLNKFTGKINFSLPTASNYVITMKVSEFDKQTGLLKGYVYRDVLIAGKTCSNNSPSSSSGNINTFIGSGTAQQIDSTSITLCQFDSAQFSMTFNDPNISDSLSIVNNITSQLPGANYTITGKNPLTLTINWKVPSGFANKTINLLVTVNDNFCPYQTNQNYVYRIKIKPGANAGNDLQVCQGDTAYLNGSGGLSYTWSLLQGDPLIVGQNIQCINCANPWVIPQQNSVYLLETNVPTNGCFYLDTVRINVAPNFTGNLLPISPEVCAGDSINLNLSLNPTSSTYTYKWVPSLKLTSSTIANPKFSYSLAGNYSYSVIADNGLGCKKIFNTTVKNNALPAVTLSPSTAVSLCKGNSTTLTATAGFANYTWSPSTALSNTNTNTVVANPSSTTTYTLTVTDTNGCVRKINKSITVNNIPVISVSPGNASICSDSTLRIIASGGSTYTWLPNTAINNIFNDTVLVNPSTTTTYTVAGYNTFGCMNVRIVPVAVTQKPTVNILIDSNTVCLSNNKTLIASSAPSYSWYTSGNLISNNDSLPISISNNTNYTLITHSANNFCAASQTINIPFVNNILIDSTISSCAGDNVALIVNDTFQVQKWTPNYNILDTLSNATIVFPDTSTIYSVSLKSNNGCSYKGNFKVFIDPTLSCELIVYNAITFNGDGMNDYWIIDRIDGRESKVVIYNAWGNKIWETTNYNNKTNHWDGTNMSGQRVPDGTYLYMIKMMDKNYNGQVELISKQ